MDEMKYLVFGDDFVTSNGIVVHNPTISEINDFGVFNYLALVNLIIMRPYDDMVNLWEQGIDYEEVSDYEMFVRNVLGLDQSISKLFFGDLNFQEFRFQINPQNGDGIDRKSVV